MLDNLSEEKSFPIEEQTIKGKEYYVMDFDIFASFFIEVVKYKNIPREIVNPILKEYNKTRSYKKKRIRLKKEKQVLLKMYNILFNN